MGVIEINKTPSGRELGLFGALLVLFFAVVGSVIQFKFSNPTAAIAVWGGGAVVGLLYALVPRLRLPVYLAWMYAAFPIGWTVSHLVLAAVYYLALTPMGLLTRLLGHDPMQRRFDPQAESYWHKRPRGRDPGRYFKQF